MAVNINIPSQVSQTITDGVTDKAPSEDAVHDALALKANSADLGATAFSNDYNDLDNLPTIPSLTGYVPYTGATTDVDLGTYNITADHINLNVSPSGAGFVVGSTQWNNTIGSSETLLKGGNVTNQDFTTNTAGVVDTEFFNCFAYGNGAESYRIRDSIVGRTFNLLDLHKEWVEKYYIK